MSGAGQKPVERERSGERVWKNLPENRAGVRGIGLTGSGQFVAPGQLTYSGSG